MDKGRLLSLKRRIGTAQSFEVTELAEELAGLAPPVPEDLTNAVTDRIAQGAFVTTGAIAALVAATRNRRLYEATREHLLTDIWALIVLLRADIPDPAIETCLRDLLYKAYPGSDDPRRSYILDALGEHGSSGCIDDLETIQYEFTPRLQTLKLMQDIGGEPEELDLPKDSQEVLKVFTGHADIQFGERLRAALQKIRERAKPIHSEWAAAGPTDDPLALAKSYIQKAEQQAVGQDYGAALNYCRKALEAALKSVIKSLGLAVKKDEPVDKLQLPALIIAINAGIILPKDVRTAIEWVQRESTFGSHDQGIAPEKVLTRAGAQVTIEKYRQVEAHLVKVISEGVGVRSPVVTDSAS